MTDHTETALRALLDDAAATVEPSTTLWDRVTADIAHDAPAATVTAYNGHAVDADLPVYPTAAEVVPMRRRPRRLVFAAAAAVIALAAGTTVVLTRSHRHAVHVLTPASNLPHFVVKNLPAGMKLQQANVNTPDSNVGMVGRTVILGTKDGTGSLVIGGYGVVAGGAAPATSAAGSVAPPTGHTVHGVPVEMNRPAQAPNRANITWHEGNAMYFVTQTRGTLDDAALLAVAESLTSSGPDGNFTVGAPPAGYDVVFDGSGVGDSASTSYQMSFGSVNPDAATDNRLDVIVGTGNAGLLATYMAESPAPFRPRTVRGHAGHASTNANTSLDPYTEMLVWEEQPGVYVVLNAAGLTADQLLEVADGLVPVSEAAWKQAMGNHLQNPEGDSSSGAVAASTSIAVATASTEVVATSAADGPVPTSLPAPGDVQGAPDFGQLQTTPPPAVQSGQLEGRPWTLHAGLVPLYAGANAGTPKTGSTVCAVLEFAKRPSIAQVCPMMSSGGDTAAHVTAFQVSDSPRHFAVLLVEPDVATVEATFDDGSTQRVTPVVASGAAPGDPRVTAIGVAVDRHLTALTTKDASGKVIGTITGDVPGDVEQSWTLGGSGGGPDGSGYSSSQGSPTTAVGEATTAAASSTAAPSSAP